MKKKLVALLLMITLAFGLVACGGDSAPANNDVEDEIEEDVEDEIEEDIEDEDEEVENDEDEVVPESEGTLVFDVPEGFTYDEASQLYTSSNADEVANINYYNTPNDGSFSTISAEVMHDLLEPALSSTYGEELDIEITGWTTIEVDGYEAVKYNIEYEYAGLAVVQTQVIVNGTDNFHYTTFTYLEMENYGDTFNAVIDSMRFE